MLASLLHYSLFSLHTFCIVLILLWSPLFLFGNLSGGCHPSLFGAPFQYLGSFSLFLFFICILYITFASYCIGSTVLVSPSRGPRSLLCTEYKLYRVHAKSISSLLPYHVGHNSIRRLLIPAFLLHCFPFLSVLIIQETREDYFLTSPTLHVTSCRQHIIFQFSTLARRVSSFTAPGSRPREHVSGH